jgi:hypothetical protein
MTKLKEAELHQRPDCQAGNGETARQNPRRTAEKERSLDKRQETIGQQTDDLRKQEKMVESTRSGG